MYELVYVDSSESCTVPVRLTYERIERILSDNSISIVRLIFDDSIVELKEISRK
jgi:hypothetical protein